MTHFQFNSQERGIGVINASPYSAGMLTPHGPQPWSSAPAHIKEACRKAVEYCQSKGVDITKLALHFTLSHNAVPLTIIGTASREEQEGNIVNLSGTLTTVEAQVLEYVLEK